MNYHNITKSDMLNGTGLRVVLWVSGCSLQCKNCHNPQTWDKDSGIPFDEDAKQEIFVELEKDYIDGITFSGGHPLEACNTSKILELVKEIREKFPKKTIWLYTGFIIEEIIYRYACHATNQHYQDTMEILKNIDVLVDGRYEEKNRDPKLHWVGSSNQRVIDVPRTLLSLDIPYMLEELEDDQTTGESKYNYREMSAYIGSRIILKESVFYDEEPSSDYKTCGCGD